jgi:hypothetical protein
MHARVMTDEPRRDASVGVKWLVPEVDSDLALRLQTATTAYSLMRDGRQIFDRVVGAHVAHFVVLAATESDEEQVPAAVSIAD